MKILTDEIIHFFHKQTFIIVSTVDRNGSPHNSCKGLVEINAKGQAYLIDLYKAKTYENLKKNPRISITAVNEHSFNGFCLKGRGKIVNAGKVDSHLAKVWEKRITGRITQRVIKNISGEKGHPHHPEALLPKPAYLISMDVEEVVDLTPHPLKIRR